MMYQYYMSDMAQCIVNDLNSYLGLERVNSRFYDIVNQTEKKDDRKGEEIVLDVVNKTGLVLV